MARGWESKAVEDQIEERKQKRLQRPTEVLSPAERQRNEKLASLQLSKSRLLDQLERVTHPTHRSTLQNGLRAIEQEIEEVMSDVV
ncbi:MAG TPA: hypothetical protein VI306_25180 [Pyrinomonadaceae bacterium]